MGNHLATNRPVKRSPEGKFLKGTRPIGNVWKKGESGNPSGRPKGSRSLSKIISEELEATPTQLQRIARKLLSRAENGDLAAIQQLWERLDGKVPNKLQAEVHELKTVILGGQAAVDGPRTIEQLPNEEAPSIPEETEG